MEQDEPQDTVAWDPTEATSPTEASEKTDLLTWPVQPQTEDPSQPETPHPHPSASAHLPGLPFPCRRPHFHASPSGPRAQAPHLCCRQCRSWDVTPAPQLREHAVHLVHSPHQ